MTNQGYTLPVTGASISTIVFSDLSKAAPSLIIFRAALSSILPSKIKCCFKISGLGLLVRWSKTSGMVSRWAGGNGTPEKKIFLYKYDVTKFIECVDMFYVKRSYTSFQVFRPDGTKPELSSSFKNKKEKDQSIYINEYLDWYMRGNKLSRQFLDQFDYNKLWFCMVSG